MKDRRTIILDGGMGTMLQARGMKAGEDSTAFALAHPDVLEDVARQYLEAGSQFVYTPTFNLTREKGAGLGLFIVKYITEQSGGSVRLRNCDKGLEVTVGLPLAEEQGEP